MLWFVGSVLIACWFGAMFDKYHSGLRIDVDENSLFIGFSMLLAGWLIALNLPSRRSTDRLASDYVVFATALGNTAMTKDQLAKEAGESTSQVLESNGAYETQITLSSQQMRSLERLIYEGKVHLVDGQYSLPATAGSA